MTTVMQAMFIDFLCITQRFIGEIKITLHYITFASPHINSRNHRIPESLSQQNTLCIVFHLHNT